MLCFFPSLTSLSLSRTVLARTLGGEAMCYRDMTNSTYFTSRCTFFIVHSLVSKDAFHHIILAIVRAYLVKSASPNSVKLCRTKSRICLSVNFLPNSISFTLPSRLSWSQGFPRGIDFGRCLNHTKVRDDLGLLAALAGEGDRDLSLAELDSAIKKKTEGTLKFYTG